MGNNDGVGVAEANGQEEHEREDEAERMEEDDANSNTDGDEDAESESEDDDEDEEDEHHEERIAEAQKNIAANPYDYNGHLKVRRLGLSNANRLTSCAVNDTVFYQMCFVFLLSINALQLISLLRRAGLLEKLREAREAMNAIFPLSPLLWMQWTEDESRLVAG